MGIKADKNMLEKDEKYIWHSMRPYDPNATMVVETADGAWITDQNGNRFLDGMSGLWCVNVGYGRTELAESAFEQLKKMPYYPLTHSHEPAIRLGEKLNEWLEEDYVIFYSNSGSEANEAAFKIARQYHRQKGDYDRHKFISRYRAYHGQTMGALAATGQAPRKYKYEPLGQGFLHVAPPDCYRSPFDNKDGSCCKAAADELDRVITWELDETIAGVIMEPMITGGGILIPHDDYLKRVREICDKHGVILIIDEVITGFGRTGKKFGFMHAGIKPDIVTMAKALTSAYLPLSATAVRRDIYEAFKGTEEYDFFRHINTFGGSPAPCAVALKNLEIMEQEGLVERSRTLGERLAEEVAGLREHPNVGDIRSRGLLLGIEMVKDKETKAPAEPELLLKIIAAAKSRGLIISKNGDTVAGFSNILTLSPPLSMTDEDFEFMVTVLKEAVWSVQ